MMDGMDRSGSLRRLGAVALLAGLVAAGGCGTGTPKAVEIDLTEPITPRQLDPSSKNLDMATFDGPADFTVLLPDRTITGRFRSVNVYGPAAVGPDVAADDPSRAVTTFDLRYEFTDDADEVVARLEQLRADYDLASGDAAALDAFIEQFRSTTAATDGRIEYDDFVSSDDSTIREFELTRTDRDGVGLQVRFMGGSDVAMTITVGFDNGAA